MLRCARVLLVALLVTVAAGSGMPARADTPAPSAALEHAATVLTPLQQAHQHYQTGRYDLAIQALEEEVRYGALRGSDRVQARELLARCYVRARRPDDAVKTFLVMLYQDPSYRPGLHVVGDERTAFTTAYRRYMEESPPPPAPPTDREGASESISRSVPTVPPPTTPSSPPLSTPRPASPAGSDTVRSAPLALRSAAIPPPRHTGAQPPPMPVTYGRSNAWMLWATAFVLVAVGTALYVDGVGRE